MLRAKEFQIKCRMHTNEKSFQTCYHPDSNRTILLNHLKA
jgi:hypothetical protein